MIQDIFPYRLDHAFRDREPEPEDCFFSFRGGEVLLRVSEDDSRRIREAYSIFRSGSLTASCRAGRILPGPLPCTWLDGMRGMSTAEGAEV